MRSTSQQPNLGIGEINLPGTSHALSLSSYSGAGQNLLGRARAEARRRWTFSVPGGRSGGGGVGWGAENGGSVNWAFMPRMLWRSAVEPSMSVKRSVSVPSGSGFATTQVWLGRPRGGKSGRSGRGARHQVRLNACNPTARIATTERARLEASPRPVLHTDENDVARAVVTTSSRCAIPMAEIGPDQTLCDA